MAKKPVIEVGERVPRSLKFGIIVAVALFWAQFIRSGMAELYHNYFNSQSELVIDLIFAVIATLIGWALLMTYPKLRAVLRKIKI